MKIHGFMILALGLSAAAPFTVSGEEMLRNTAFRDGLKSWQSAPLSGAAQNGDGSAAVGKKARFYQNAAVRPGTICNMEIELSAEKGTLVQTGAEFFSKDKKWISQTHAVLAPDKRTGLFRFAFIAPEKAAFMNAVCVPLNGPATFSRISVDNAGIFTGVRKTASITADKDFYTVSNPGVRLSFAARRLFSIVNFGMPDAGVFESLVFYYAPEGEKQRDEYYFGGRLEKIELHEETGSLEIGFEYSWPEARGKKTVSFFTDSGAVKLEFELEALSGFKLRACGLDIVSGKAMRFLSTKGVSALSSIRWKGYKWFTLQRPDVNKWIAFSDEEDKFGAVVAGTSAETWNQIDGGIMCSARKNGGFSISPTKTAKLDVRRGDRLFSAELFIVPFIGAAAEKAPGAASIAASPAE